MWLFEQLLDFMEGNYVISSLAFLSFPKSACLLFYAVSGIFGMLQNGASCSLPKRSHSGPSATLVKSYICSLEKKIIYIAFFSKKLFDKMKKSYMRNYNYTICIVYGCTCKFFNLCGVVWSSYCDMTF